MVSDPNARKDKAFSIRRWTNLPRPHLGVNWRILEKYDSQGPKSRYEAGLFARNKKRSFSP